MKLFVAYAALFVTALLVFIVAFAPASLVWRLVSDDASKYVPQLQVRTIQGTIWSGKARLAYLDFPDTTVSWTTRPGALLLGRVDVHVQAIAEHLHVDGMAHITPSGFDLTTEGKVGSEYINPVSRIDGLTYSGELTTTAPVELTSDFSWITRASGSLHWSGGNIVYFTAQGAQTIDLPPLDGVISRNGQNVQLDVNHAVNTLIVVDLRPTGWVAVNLKARLFELAKLPWPSGQSPDDTALTLEEQVFGSR